MAIPAPVYKSYLKPFQSGIALLQHFFSRKEVSVCCFVLAILFKSAMTFYFFQFDTDKLYQAMAAKSLVEGHGLTINQVHAGNLSKEYYEPMVGWPPGYTIVIAAIYPITKDLVVSCIIADIIAIVFFLITLRLLLTTLQIPVYLINVLLLFNSLIITNSIVVSAPTDLLALAFILLHIYLQLRMYKKQATGIRVALAALINVVPACLRYMYIPGTFVIPAILLWNGWFKKDKSVFKNGIYNMLVALVGITSLLIFQKTYSGSAGYVLQSERGIFWYNVIQLPPVVFNSFINITFYLVQLSSLIGVEYRTLDVILQRCSLVVSVFLLIRFLQFAFNKKLITGSLWQFFVITSGGVSISVLLVLGYLSLTYSSYHPPPANTTVWTYISDARYYVFMNLLITVITGKWLFIDTFTVFKGKKGLQFLYLLLLFIEISHGIYYLGKHFTFDRRNNKVIAIQNKMDGYLKDLINENKQKNVDVVVTNGYNSAPRAILMGGKGLIAVKELNAIKLHVQKPTLLIFVAREDHLAFYKPFFDRTPLQFRSKIDQVYFYTYFIEPGF